MQFDISSQQSHAFGLAGLPLAYAPTGAGFVAITRDSSLVSPFGSDGTRLGWFGWRAASGRPIAVAWSPDGTAIALFQNKTGTDVGGLIAYANSAVVEVPPRDDGFVVNYQVPPGSNVSVRWSHDSQRLALVTVDRVRVFDRDGAPLWTVAGEFFGNPRWSPDDKHLYVNAMPGNAADVAYVFTADGEPLWRFASTSPASGRLSYGFGCGGEHWIDEERIGIGPYIISRDGEVIDLREPGVPNLFVRILEPLPTDLDITVDPSVGWHIVHYGDERLTYLNDGRYVFSTPQIGHDGCATGLAATGSSYPEGLERPPFQ